MKKQIVWLLAFSCVTAAFAFEKGTKTLGGTVSFSSVKYGDGYPALSQFSIAPYLGYCVIDNLMIEVNPRFSLATQKGESTSTGFGLGIGGRYFIGRFYLGSMFGFFSSGTKELKYSSQEGELKAGYLLPLAKNLFFDLGARYGFGIGKIKIGDTKVDNDESGFSLAVGIATFFK